MQKSSKKNLTQVPAYDSQEGSSTNDESTSHSVAGAKDFTSIYSIESTRYTRKGYGLIVSVILALAYIGLGPNFMRGVINPCLNQFDEVFGYPKWAKLIIFTCIWHSCWFITANFMMWCIYHVKKPFFERYKISSQPWPWEENPEEWRKLLKKSIMCCAINNLLTTPLSLLLSLYIEDFNIRFSFNDEDMPDIPKLAATFLFSMMCEDMLFHLTHRLLHHPIIYPYFHKVHHQYIESVGIAAEYSHPLDYYFTGFLPSALSGLILGKHMHIATVYYWMIARIFETVDGHCGYEFSWSPFRVIPFSGSTTYHNYHHSHNVGNYSSMFTFWDTVFGTNKDFYEFNEKEQNKQGKIKAK